MEENQIVNIEVRTEKGPHYTAFYCNNIAYAMGAIDFVLILGEVVNTGKEIYIEQRARVTMSPIQAKVMRDILTERLSVYESHFGEVKVPVEVQAKVPAS